MSVFTLIIAFGGAVAVVMAFLRWVWPQVKTGGRVLVAFRNAVLGTEEVRHPDTNVVLVPAQPGLNARVASIEVAVHEIAKTHRRLDEHEVRIGRLERAADETQPEE